MRKIKEVRRFRKRFLALCVGLVGFAVCAASSARAGTVAFAPGATPKENAATLQAAIDAANAAGGGRVTVPAGTWTCATLWLKSGVELHLAEGAVLQASANHDDYNALDAYPENWGCPETEYWDGRHFIICYRQSNVSITGPGEINGNGDAFFDPEPIRYWPSMTPNAAAWWNGIRWAKDKKRLRPGQLVVFVFCRDVRVSNLTIRNSPCWCLFLAACENVDVTDYTVRCGMNDGNTDGIDIDCCRHVRVENVDIDVGDDAVAVRASGHRLGDPDLACEDVRIRKAKLASTSSVFRIGVGRGAIRDLIVEDVTCSRGGTAVTMNASYGDPAQSGVDMENIVFRRCDFAKSRYGYKVKTEGALLKFGIRNVTFEDCDFGSLKGFVGAAPGCPFKPENVRFTSTRSEDVKELPFLCRGEGLALWTNDMTSVKSAAVVGGGLEVRTASWREVGLAADIPDDLKLGPDDEFVFRAKATCPSTGRPAVVGTIAAQYKGEPGFAANRTEFCWILDGQWHDYRVRAFDSAAGRILKRIKLGLPPEARASGVIVISEIAIRSRPVAPCFTVMNAAADGFARTDAPVGLRVRVWNRGTVEAKNVTLTPDALPAGVEWVTRPSALGVVPRDGCGNFCGSVRCAKPMAFVLRLTLAADGVRPTTVEVPVKVEAVPAARKADYVPEPKPPKCAYDIAACYFPGWMERKRWSKIERMCPERKPLLGWYDETNPEAIDWQIKWYAEHGIGILMMDWYWNKANIRLDHWLKAFAQAKWRKYLRWSVMWCNESQKPNHSVEDNRKLVRHWIDNYFGMPEYYRIDDKPVVGIFVPEHLMRDLGVQGTKDFLSEARKTARTAGYKGIHFIGYFRPTDDAGGTVPVQFRDLGFDEVAIYNYYGHFGAAEAPRRYAWKHVEETSRADWERRTKSSNVPFWPMLGTGRDERPWVNRTEVYGRTVASFSRMCREMRKFVDEKGLRRIQLGPVNEWGEGSYIEPCVEFGFGMFDAVRDAFCEKPSEGWPENVVPSDLGLGPYDLPAGEPAPVAGEAMDLTDATLHGWYPLGSHVKSLEPTKEGLHVTAETGTPAIYCDYEPFEAAKFSRLVVRMKSSLARGTFRLYWRGEEMQWCEAASATCPIVKEDGWRDYVFDLSSRPAWCQRIFEIRLQPSGKPPFDYVISSVRFE